MTTTIKIITQQLQQYAATSSSDLTLQKDVLKVVCNCLRSTIQSTESRTTTSSDALAWDVVKSLLTTFSAWMTIAHDPNQQQLLLRVVEACGKHAISHQQVISTDLYTAMMQTLGNLFLNARRAPSRITSAHVLTDAWHTMTFGKAEKEDGDGAGARAGARADTTIKVGITDSTTAMIHGLNLLHVLCTLGTSNTVPRADVHQACVQSLLLVLQLPRSTGKTIGHDLHELKPGFRVSVLMALFACPSSLTDETTVVTIVHCLVSMYCGGSKEVAEVLQNEVCEQLDIIQTNKNEDDTSLEVGTSIINMWVCMWEFSQPDHGWAPFAFANIESQNVGRVCAVFVANTMIRWLSYQIEHRQTNYSCAEHVEAYTNGTSKWMSAHRSLCRQISRVCTSSWLVEWLTEHLVTKDKNTVSPSSSDWYIWFSIGLTMFALLEKSKMMTSKEIPSLLNLVLHHVKLLHLFLQDETDTNSVSWVTVDIWNKLLEKLLNRMDVVDYDTATNKLFRWSTRRSGTSGTSGTSVSAASNNEKVECMTLMVHCINIIALKSSADGMFSASLTAATYDRETGVTAGHRMLGTLAYTAPNVSNRVARGERLANVRCMVANTVKLWVSYLKHQSVGGSSSSTSTNNLETQQRRTSTATASRLLWCVTHVVRPNCDTEILGTLLPLVCPLVEQYDVALKRMGLVMLEHLLRATSPTAFRFHSLLVVDVTLQSLAHDGDIVVLATALRCIVLCAVLARQPAGSSITVAATLSTKNAYHRKQRQQHSPLLDTCVVGVLNELKTTTNVERRALFLSSSSTLVELCQTSFVVHLPMVMPWILGTLDDAAALCSTGYVGSSFDDVAALLSFLNTILRSCWPCVKFHRAVVLRCMCRLIVADCRLKVHVVTTCLLLGNACQDYDWVTSRLEFIHREISAHPKISPKHGDSILELMKLYTCTKEKQEDNGTDTDTDQKTMQTKIAVKWYDPVL